ncbi:hypothetical protein DICPUDRAFT_157741 [Dictyostelium purpureum]|uniref:Uncharacterized protein n=1 Tax=Dictyostelium purpureum TaxID=5786 RepID=F0ZZW0_DICPU|nr:uncharacterized protein DICPUDRAFT_157741 [Dictyostelium purpureum]EGC30527.1 hypothetical protein DICPUDRAFT_157741 [Dictyostelium purpureum]|eukprot:XP_003292950.1 hypothetical protein DICPUDRAFT_157741 [Dictyostelium purpureum]
MEMKIFQNTYSADKPNYEIYVGYVASKTIYVADNDIYNCVNNNKTTKSFNHRYICFTKTINTCTIILIH